MIQRNRNLKLNMEIMTCPECGSEEILTAPVGYLCEDFGEEFLKGSKGIASEVIDPLEGKMWDHITDSAKRRFDYRSFSEIFDNFFEAKEIDNILWMIIMETAADQEVLGISSHIFMELAILGITLPKDDIK